MNKAPTFGHSGFLMETPAVLQSGAARRGPALVAGLLWLAAGLSAGYWVLQFLGRSPVTPVATVGTAPAQPDAMAVARDETRTGSVRPVTDDSNPIAIGENLFRTVQPTCVACHSIQSGVQLAGPSLAGIAEQA